MAISFRSFLTEGGNATKEWGTSRATSADIKKALEYTADATGISVEFLTNSVLGGTRTTLGGFKASSGDIDIAMPTSEFNALELHKKMMDAVGDEGEFNKGTNVGSYAVPVGKDKKVQVDLMYVPHREWAMWMYHSAEGEKSKFPGAVRNMLVGAIVGESLPKMLSTKEYDIYSDGKNLRIFDKTEEKNEVLRAAVALKIDTGLERLFKVAPVNSRTGKRNKTMKKATPEEVRTALQELGFDEIEFDSKNFLAADPAKVVKTVFGAKAKPEDFMTVEDVIHWCYENLTDAQRNRVFNKASETLDRAKIDKSKRPIELQ